VNFALALVNRIIELREKVQSMSQAKAMNQFVLQELEKLLIEMGSISPNNHTKV